MSARRFGSNDLGPNFFEAWKTRWDPHLFRLSPLTPPGAPPSIIRRVLLVEDDAVIMKTTTMKLRAHGCQVFGASNAVDALKLAIAEQPDVIILDISFPTDSLTRSCDGYLLQGCLRRLEQTKDIPVIFITSEQATPQRERALSSGAIGFFPKPIDHPALISLIEERLAGVPPRPRKLPTDFGAK